MFCGPELFIKDAHGVSCKLVQRELNMLSSCGIISSGKEIVQKKREGGAVKKKLLVGSVIVLGEQNIRLLSII